MYNITQFTFLFTKNKIIIIRKQLFIFATENQH